MGEEKFICASCGKEHEGDLKVTAVQECRVCFRTHCDECINEDGICVPCSEVEEEKK